MQNIKFAKRVQKKVNKYIDFQIFPWYTDKVGRQKDIQQQEFCLQQNKKGSQMSCRTP